MQEENTTDNFNEGFDNSTRIVTIKYFSFESEARIYAARLDEAGIKSFISNANTSTVIHLGQSSIGLHVKEEEAEQATLIIRKLDYKGAQPSLKEASFHDADEEDIAFERSLNQKNTINPIIGIIVIIMVLIMLIAALISTNTIKQFWGEAVKKTSTQWTYQENKLMSGLAL